MSHDSFEELVFALHDGELSPAERARAEAHLAECSACRAVLEGWKKSAPAFFRAPAAPPSEAFVQRVMAALPAAAPRADWREFFTFPRLALAGAGALVLVLFLRPDRPPMPVDPSAAVLHVASVLGSESPDAEEGTGPEEAVEEYFL
jgi:anti-sigma factor RsiW